MNIKFKERATTNYIQVTCCDMGGISYEELYRLHRRKGDFHVDVHYFIDRGGFLHEGRPDKVVAGIDLDGVNDTVHILIDIDGKINDCQKITYNELIDVLLEKYPNVKIIGGVK